jgi:hypothetical protein
MMYRLCPLKHYFSCGMTCWLRVGSRISRKFNMMKSKAWRDWEQGNAFDASQRDLFGRTLYR